MFTLNPSKRLWKVLLSLCLLFITISFYYQINSQSHQINQPDINNKFLKDLLSKNSNFENFNKDKKCEVYFKHLHSRNSSWSLNYHKDPVNEFDQISEEVRHLRMFNKCFIDVDKSANNKRDKIAINKSSKIFYGWDNLKYLWKYLNPDLSNVLKCENLNSRLYPFLTNEYPEFTRWTGEKFSNGFPDIEKYSNNKIKEEDEKINISKLKFEQVFGHNSSNPAGKNSCLINYYKEHIKGKGIVVTTNGLFSPQVISLIKLLRALGNKLPIQIFHTGLSRRRYSQIINAARDSIEDLNFPKDLFELLNSDQKKISKNFPKQEVWFVYYKDTIDPKIEIQKYHNKIISLLFSSFEDVILMDADAVPLVPIEDFFQTNQYKSTKTLFFLDRTDLRFNKPKNTNFFKRLMPNKEIDEKYLLTKSITDHTLKNRFMSENFYYFMEAGIVLINKREHFGGVLMSVVLSFWDEVIKDMVWGDKELYWLGLTLNGDENYQFNSHNAVSVGEFSNKKQHLYPNSNSNEICSTHPGQLSDNDNHTLLWLNSGFETCKNIKSVTYDLREPKFKEFNRQDLKKHYKSPLKINGIIEPAKSLDVLANDFGKPETGWLGTSFCDGYLWCAYDLFGGFENDEDNYHGLMIKYNETEINWFNYLGGVWLYHQPK